MIYDDEFQLESLKAFEDIKYKLYYENHYFLWNHLIFDYINEMLNVYIKKFSICEKLFRARRIENGDNKKLDDQKFFSGFNRKDSFVPPAKITRASRANLDRIPCLYVATDVKTAIAEVRPFLGKKISVATIEPAYELNLFDLYIDPNLTSSMCRLCCNEHFAMDCTDCKENKADIKKTPFYKLWLKIAQEFSIPYENSSNYEYFLTQFISEYIRLNSDFDGIQYSSSLTKTVKI